MSKNEKNTESEIDLSEIRQEMGSMLEKLNFKFFRFLQFLIKNSIYLAVLFVIGIALGFWLDTNRKTYTNELIVSPNVGSRDYLYSKVLLLDSKIKEKDTVFLKNVGFPNPSKLSRVEIEPIVDVYPFINHNEKNFEILKLMAENGDIKKILEEPTTSKNYIYHRITFITKGPTSNVETVKPLLDYFNHSVYFESMLKEAVNNVKLKMLANERTISQINGILDDYASNNVAGDGKKSNLVYINSNTQLNDVIQTKDLQVRELGDLRVELVRLNRIVKLNSQTLNVKDVTSVNGKLKFVLPLLLMFLFMVFALFVRYYKRVSLRVNAK
jgi:hypothetical protein